MTRQRLRIFVSSPGDVMAAREVAAQIIEKVAHEYARFFTIEPYLWEYEPMLASGHFQDSIDPPSRFDAPRSLIRYRQRKAFSSACPFRPMCADGRLVHRSVIRRLPLPLIRFAVRRVSHSTKSLSRSLPRPALKTRETLPPRRARVTSTVGR
jgi:hypothetical protein